MEIRRLRQIQDTPLDQPLPLEATQGRLLGDADFTLLDSTVDSPLDSYTDAVRRTAATASQFSKKIDDSAKSEEFKDIPTIKTQLDPLKKLVDEASKETILRLVDHTKKNAEQKDAELRQKQAAMNQTIDSAKRQQIQDELRLLIVQGRKTSLEINEIDLDYQLAIQRAKSALVDSREKLKPGQTGEHPRIKRAREEIQALIAKFLIKRANDAVALVQKLDESSPEGKTNLTALLKMGTGITSKKEVLALLEKDRTDLTNNSTKDYTTFEQTRDNLNKKLAIVKSVLS